VEGFFGRALGGLYLFVALAKTLLLPFPKKKITFTQAASFVPTFVLTQS
jgi:hypothetical protein